MPDLSPIAIRYPAGVYFYGPFPSVPGMSRPRVIYAGTPAPACPVIIADTPSAARRLDLTLVQCARFCAANPPGAFIDPAQWLTNREISHAATLADCRVIWPGQCAADGCSAPAMDTGYLCHDCQADMMPGADPAREAAEARWHFHDGEDTLDLY